jgi:hypothetical protein
MTRPAPPPQAISKAKLDNLALVPASLLPYKAQWQQLANELPSGSTLIVFPTADLPQRATLEIVAARLRAKGRVVATVPAQTFTLQLH